MQKQTPIKWLTGRLQPESFCWKSLSHGLSIFPFFLFFFYKGQKTTRKDVIPSAMSGRRTCFLCLGSFWLVMHPGAATEAWWEGKLLRIMPRHFGTRGGWATPLELTVIFRLLATIFGGPCWPDFCHFGLRIVNWSLRPTSVTLIQHPASSFKLRNVFIFLFLPLLSLAIPYRCLKC